MDIFAFALKMEKDGRDFYLKLAGKTKNKGLAGILEMLAEEELKHYKAIQAIHAKKHEMAPTGVLERAKNMFQRMKDFGEHFDIDISELEFYRQAMTLEEQSRDFYLDRADEAKDPQNKELFSQLAGEEKKHYILLENIADFVSRPQQWLENAEFFHIEDY